MEELHLPNNIKVHWAGAEVQNQYIETNGLGVRYALYTAYPFVERMVFKKGCKSPIMPLDWQKDNPFAKIPQYIENTSLHCIQDSGLFTLMFGAGAGEKHSEQLINKWYDNLVEFTLQNAHKATCVEVDCQKILGVEKAWEFRQRMRNDLPNNRIINVFHFDDGMKGLDRLIDYSDYIAVSVPELRRLKKTNHIPSLVRHIKARKPTIDIHLLGCTEIKLIEQCKDLASTADSTSYVCGKRYGFYQNMHISTLNTEKVKAMGTKEDWDMIAKYNNDNNTRFLLWTTQFHKQKYQKSAGNQDYYANV